MERANTFVLVLLILTFAGLQNASAELGLARFFGIGDKLETPLPPHLAKQLAATIQNIPQIGTAISKIDLIQGIRAMDGEIASLGETKILVDLDWQALPDHPIVRKALDDTAAHIIDAVFSQHNGLNKIRVIVKIPNANGKYQSAAKVFSFTRATWQLTKNNPRYDLGTAAGAANLLALGDYVVLTEAGWIRGY